MDNPPQSSVPIKQPKLPKSSKKKTTKKAAVQSHNIQVDVNGRVGYLRPEAGRGRSKSDSGMGVRRSLSPSLMGNFKTDLALKRVIKASVAQMSDVEIYTEWGF